MKRVAYGVMGVGLAVLLVACGKANTPTAEEVLGQGADKMAAIQTVGFDLVREGDPVTLDLGLGMISTVDLLGATGVYQAPDSVYATATISPGPMEVQVWWLSAGTYIQASLLPSAVQVDLGDAFNPVVIFNPDEGLPAILRGLDNPTLEGTETTDGIEMYHVKAQEDGENLNNLVGGILAPGTDDVDVWIATDTGYVYEVLITESTGDTWEVDFYSFDEPVDIPQP